MAVFITFTQTINVADNSQNDDLNLENVVENNMNEKCKQEIFDSENEVASKIPCGGDVIDIALKQEIAEGRDAKNARFSSCTFLGNGNVNVNAKI